MQTGRQPERQEPLLLRIHPDVTRITNLGRTTIYQEIGAGRLRAIKVGRAVRVRRDDLEAWIERHTTGVGRTAPSQEGPRRGIESESVPPRGVEDANK